MALIKFIGKIFKRLFALAIAVFLVGIIPQNLKMPVKGAKSADYHPDSFWFHPWGKSGTHKGVDIFAQRGTPVLASTSGLVVFSGNNGRGGKAILMLGPKWCLHYYAHLHQQDVKAFDFCAKGRKIGSVGNTGNAAFKPSHLHYSILSLVPYPWRIDFSPQGWKKAFFMNPIEYL